MLSMARRRIFNISDTINCFKPFKCQAALFKLEIVSVSTFVVGCLHEFSFVRFLLFYLCYFYLPAFSHSLTLERTLFISILWRAYCFILRFISGYWCFFLLLLQLHIGERFSMVVANIHLHDCDAIAATSYAHNYFKRYYKMNIKRKWECELRRWDTLLATENFKL